MDNTINLSGFKCTQCGDCCRWSGSVLLTEADVTALAAHLGLSEHAFIQEHTTLSPNRVHLILIDRPDRSCRFLENDRCQVYEARPVQCSSFPYAWTVESGCPGLDALKAEAGQEEE